MCLNILKQDWSPVLMIEKVLISVVALLTDPNPVSPENITAAHIFLHDKNKFEKEAKNFTSKHAKIVKYNENNTKNKD